jgi:hypothetical protein
MQRRILKHHQLLHNKHWTIWFQITVEDW